jgi:diaminopimelate decarboxylase
MKNLTLPFNKAKIEEIVKTHPTPFHIYDQAAIRENAKKFYTSFSWAPGFKNYFAVKALPNPHILKILKEEGMGVDCSSLAELVMSERVGFRGEEIMFTSNETPAKEYLKAFELGAIINLDDISHLEFLEETLGKLPELLCFRYNPGPNRTGNALIGDPKEAKYGLTKDQLFEAYKTAKEKGVKRLGLHTMVASNELNADYIIETARMLFDLVKELKSEGVDIEFINMGGGIGIPYKPDQVPMDINYVSSEIKKIYNENLLEPLKIVFECGRVITGPYGYLVTKAIHKKNTYKQYIGVDACMSNLMRPGMYGAYHHETVLGKENEQASETYDVVGSLCENNDKFAIDRKLPKIEIGDYIVIHDTGAHGFAMGFNYNGKLRSAELLLRPDGKVEQIRRAETLDDYFATLDFSKV